MESGRDEVGVALLYTLVTNCKNPNRWALWRKIKSF